MDQHLSPTQRPHATLVNGAGSRPPVVYLMNWPHGEHPMLDIAGRIGADQPVWCLNAPPEAAFGRIPDVAGWVAWYREQLDVIALKPPYRIAGWSFGGVLAIELGRMLADEGLEVDWLAMLDSWLPIPVPLKYLPFIAQEVVVAYDEIPSSARRASHLAFHTRQFWHHRYLRTKRRGLRAWRKRGGSSDTAAASPEAARFGIRVAWLKYRARPVTLPVELFPTENSIAKWNGDLSLGWSRVLRGGYQVHVVPGEHRTMFFEPQASVLAEALRRSVDAPERRRRAQEASRTDRLHDAGQLSGSSRSSPA